MQFPEMPPTFYALQNKKDVPAQMTVFLPTNYDTQRQFPLLMLLSGGDGGAGGNPGVARGICQDRDFICVSVPLFRAPGYDPAQPATGGTGYVITEPDGRAMWPLYKRMLAKLEEMVPNIDPAHRILGGFSNGAHATAALIDGSDGEATQWFCAFVCVEGAGKLQHYERLRGKPFLMVSSNSKSAPRARQIRDAAEAAGAKATLLVEDVGKHDFPVSAYPKVREWLLETALKEPPEAPQGVVE